MFGEVRTIREVGIYLKWFAAAFALIAPVGGFLCYKALEHSSALARVETRVEGTDKTLDRIDRNLEAVRASVDAVRAHQDRADVDHGTIKTALKVEAKKAEAARPTPTAFEGYYGAAIKDPTVLEALMQSAAYRARDKVMTPGEGKVIWVYTDDPKSVDFLKGVSNPKIIPAPQK